MLFVASSIGMRRSYKAQNDETPYGLKANVLELPQPGKATERNVIKVAGDIKGAKGKAPNSPIQFIGHLLATCIDQWVSAE